MNEKEVIVAVRDLLKDLGRQSTGREPSEQALDAWSRPIVRDVLEALRGPVVRRREGLPPFIVLVDGVTGNPEVFHPHYLSTACQHNEHETCRKVCKFCPAKCRCDCHKEDV